MRIVLLLALMSSGLFSQPVFEEQRSGIDASLRGVSAVNDQVGWASGAKGTLLRTIDGGRTWTPRPVPGAGELDFRDVHGVSDRVAYLMSAGPGDRSKVFQTVDGGQTWQLLLTNPDAQGFFDAIAFWDERRGLLMGDPVDGRFVILRTVDGGKRWERMTTPAALPGESAFAASGTCLIVGGRKEAWFVTGGTGGSRVFRSTDAGTTWKVAETPVRKDAASAGIFSVAFAGRLGIVVGGDYAKPERAESSAALSTDGGRTWMAVPDPGPGGFRSAVVMQKGGLYALAIGSHGVSYSRDRGRRWLPLAAGGYHAISITAEGAGWAVGAGGRIARVVITR